MNTENIKGYHFLIKGKVQGVGFRYFTREAAISMNLEGWVRNLVDGDVECVVCGKPQTLEIFETSLRQGPALSRVQSVNKRELAAQDLEQFVGTGFQIT